MATAAEFKGFRLLKELRAAGFTCPGGTYFEPNSGEFEFDCSLWRGGLDHSEDMGARNYFSHVTPEGLDPFDRTEPYGLATFSENIAAGVQSAEGTLEQWKTSDGHCTNMMSPTHNRASVSYAYAGSSTYKHYWTQLFATDFGTVNQSCYPDDVDRVEPAPTPTPGPTPEPTPAPTPAPGSTPAPTYGSGGSEECVDEDPNCGGYRQRWCQSGQYKSYMTASCRAFCGLCGGDDEDGGSSGGSEVCADEDPDCGGYRRSWCESGQYTRYMSDNCQAFCGLCGGGGASGGTGGGATGGQGDDEDGGSTGDGADGGSSGDETTTSLQQSGGGDETTSSLQQSGGDDETTTSLQQSGGDDEDDEDDEDDASSGDDEDGAAGGGSGGGSDGSSGGGSSGGSGAGAGDGSCRDRDLQCSDYSTTFCRSGSRYAEYMQENCAAFCGQCSSGGSGSGGGGNADTCIDEDQFCAYYDQNWCSDGGYKSWMQENCMAFCKMC